jgi:hypothetical protein
MLFVANRSSFCGEPLTGAHRWHRSEDHHQVTLPANLHAQDGEPAIRVEEGNPLDKTGNLF